MVGNFSKQPVLSDIGLSGDSPKCRLWGIEFPFVFGYTLGKARIQGGAVSVGARFNYHKKGNNEYNPYGSEFTERQKQIIRGEPVDGVRMQEVTVIMRKAEKLGLYVIAEMVYEQYMEAYTGKTPPKYSIEEAKKKLQDLTPWKR